MTTRGEMLRARFPDELHKTFAGRGGMALTYVEDEACMDRLDEVLGLGAWQWKVEPVPGSDAVKGQLIVRWDQNAEPCVYQDFGYPTNASGVEPLKEASTDAFRRCARMVGVARYVYAGEVEQAHRPVVASRPAAPSAGEGQRRPSPAPVPEEPDMGWDVLPAVAADILDAGPLAGDLCPAHAKPWHLVPAGVSKKSGRPYDAFYACQERGCDAKPTTDWTARHAR